MAQLQVADVHEEQDAGWVLDLLNLKDGQKLKTASSRRQIPVPAVLVDAGFVAYREQMRSRGETWLFPDLVQAVNGSRSGNWSKWWGRYARAVIGIEDPRKVFHSLRHSLKTACRAAQIPEEIHDALTGHSSGKVGRGYGSHPLPTLRRAINKIRYPKLTPPVGVWILGGED
jgi:integrase